MLINLGQTIYDIFGANGSWGVVLCIFLIFLLDALIIPTLPELFFIICFTYDPSISFGIELLIAAIIAEWIGIFTLYYVVEHIRIPHKVSKIVNKYVKFLILGDERLLLINRVAPMIPFAGAFISIMKWDVKKSLFYITLGCVLKYGAIMLMSNIFYSYFSGPDAQTYTLIFIFAIIIISFIASFIMKKRNGLTDEDN